MSISITIYLGPWVEFRIPAGKLPRYGIVADQDEDVFSQPNRMSDIVGLSPDGSPCIVYQFTPNKKRPGFPTRRMCINGKGAIDECIVLDDCDLVGECLWLRSVYAAEIGRMEEASGVKATVHWGLLKGCS